MSLENWVNWELIAPLSLSLSLSVQKQYRLPPGSHPAVAPLCLWLYRGSTGCLPVAIQQRPCLFLCLCSSSSSYEYLPAAAAPLSLCLCSVTSRLAIQRRPLLDGCRKVTGTASAQTRERERGAAAAGWLTVGIRYCSYTDKEREKRHSFCCMAAGR
jgi:hypothetical protein